MSTIVGMFDDHQQAQQVINELDGLGLEEGSIHVLTREGVESGGTSGPGRANFPANSSGWA